MHHLLTLYFQARTTQTLFGSFPLKQEEYFFPIDDRNQF